MKSAAMVAPLVLCIAVAGLAGCASESAGAVDQPTDARASDAEGEPANATVADATSPPTDAGASDTPGLIDAALDAYSGPCTFSADAFDLSCTTDTDCVGVPAGYYCSPAQCGCTPIGISRSALGAFNAAEAKTPLGSGAVVGVDCGCPAAPPICCRSGQCQTGFTACALPADSGTE